MHFMYNSVFEFADEIGLDQVTGMPRDFLHWIILGLFGYHIVRAIIYLISKTILADAYLTEHGNRRAPVNQTTMYHVWRGACQALQLMNPVSPSLQNTRNIFSRFMNLGNLVLLVPV